MRKLKNMIMNIVRRATVTLGGEDKVDFAIQQVTYLGKTGNCTMISPYGHHANLPANNEVEVVMFSMQGQEDNRHGIGYTPKLRPRELPVGEVVYYHPLSQSKMQYKNNGDIEINIIGDNGSFLITVKKDLTITVGGNASITVAGSTTLDTTGKVDIISGTDTDITAGGDVNVTATGDANISAATINLN